MEEQVVTPSLDEVNQHLSKNLCLLMERDHISESELARALGLPYNTIHRLISGHTTDPRISTLKSIASYFKVSLDSLYQANGLSDEHRAIQPPKNTIDKHLLHYILKHSHRLYPITLDSNDDYADFVLGLLQEVQAIDTSEENLIKIINLAIGSISSYEETRNKHSV